MPILFAILNNQLLALIKSAREESVAVRIKELKSTGKTEREMVAKALEWYDKQLLVGGLLKGLENDDVFVRRKSVDMVGYYINDDRALRKLSMILKGDPIDEVRTAAYEALKKGARKLQYFDISIPTTTANDSLQSIPLPP